MTNNRKSFRITAVISLLLTVAYISGIQAQETDTMRKVSDTVTDRSGAPEDRSSSSVGKWHPKMFYVELPDLSMRFILPYEQDQSGFYNMFFISKGSGETLLLDTIKCYWRDCNLFSSKNCYDVILLYNNGKYVKYNDMIFENGDEVDMSDQCIQSPDSVSEHWKTMKPFDNTINDRVSDRKNMAVSDFIIKGYVFSNLDMDKFPWESGLRIWNWELTVQSSGNIVKRKSCADNGYFEIDVENDNEQTLSVSTSVTWHQPKDINFTASCGLFLVMRGFGRARKVSQ